MAGMPQKAKRRALYVPSRQRPRWTTSPLLWLLLALFALSMLALLILMNTTRREWNESYFSLNKKPEIQPGIVPFDLTMNNLHVIQKAGGTLPQQILPTEEDFLPVTMTLPELRFRLKPATGASYSAVRDISAYRIEAVEAHNSNDTLWDSGRVTTKTGMPSSIPWGNQNIPVGSIVKWRVHVWDCNGVGPSTSEWHKFAVGPKNDEWKSQWITHPTDLNAFRSETNLWRHGVNTEQCDGWLKRRDLPVMMSKFKLEKDITSALLVVSGLGSFQAYLDGRKLSSYSVLDPPLTDFTERVSYRGFDVTPMLQNTTGEIHIVSVLLGSGWWDSRPLSCCIVSINLLPRGPLTCTAQLHVNYKDGTKEILIPTSKVDWQVQKGFLRESDLFTGEVVDLDIQINDLKEWIQPEIYKSPITRAQWREDLSERSEAKQRHQNEEDQLHFTVAPIGKLVPCEIPPVMPIERIAPESVTDLGSGRWLFDFGKAMSGVLRFDKGIPAPIVPEGGYPRGHSVLTRNEHESFVTVVHGDSIELETAVINLNIVAGFGLREKGRGDLPGLGGPCYPRDHKYGLMQRDVYIASKNSLERFADVRQPLFTFHGFRFAEMCCTAQPPKSVSALAYRTAFPEWGRFDSSNVLLNGAYELTKNALNSNMLGTQTDCPHREKLQYGGDLVADSPAAMHLFDLSSFYSKIIHDWMDTQWDNGAYTETSMWQDLNDYAGIGHGAGETVWASLPAVLTVRHFQHYGDIKLAEESFDYHVKWLEFLRSNWQEGMNKLFYERVGKHLERYNGNQGGLGDWLSLLSRDTWLTHNAFFMASARCVAYLAEKLGNGKIKQEAFNLADEIKKSINQLYMRDDDDGFRMKRNLDLTPGPELGLFARIVPGNRRCSVVREWIRVTGSEEPIYGLPKEETTFFKNLNKKDLNELIELGIAEVHGSDVRGLWKRGRNMPEGIFAVRYNLKALSAFGFHNIALNKVTGIGFPSYEYHMSHNATTLWETWFRSEDIFSRNHAMLGAVAEWLPASVAGVSLDPKTVGGENLLFWPRFPTSAATLQYASATQGTKRGDAAIAWEFLDLPEDTARSYDAAVVKIHLRILVPPGSSARVLLPRVQQGSAEIKYAQTLPDLEKSTEEAANECTKKRKAGMGFEYNWEFNNITREWRKVHRKKAIGTPCKSFLFAVHLDEIHWSPPESIPLTIDKDTEISVQPGLFDFVIDPWKLMKELHSADASVSYCTDPDTESWDIKDATHII